MSTSRKQMRDNLEEAAGNLMEYVSSESLRQELIEDMRRVYEEYNAPREKWFFGYIYRLYRRRAGDITLATKKLEDNASETDGLEIIANYFKTGAWNETSANSILMRILVEKVEKLYKYDHNPLDLEQLKRLNTLFVRQVNVRIKENLFFEMGRKDRRNEIDDIHNADVSDVEGMVEPEIVKFYEAPPRRKIDFANNPTYKKVAVELSRLLGDQKDEEVVKSYVAPPRRKIKFDVNPEFPDINLSNIEEKLSDVFTNVPADVVDDEDAVGVTMHGQINRFEHYNPEIDIEMGYGDTQPVDADVVDNAWLAESDEDFDPRQTEDLLVAHEDANNMGFTTSELAALLDALEHANTKTAAQTFISDAELNALLDELNEISIPSAVSELVADEHLVVPSPQEIDNLIAELRNVITPEASKELSAKERFAANRKKIESHFNEVLNRRADLIREMEQEEREEEEEEETRSFSDLRKAEDDEDEKSQYSQYSESSDSSSSPHLILLIPNLNCLITDQSWTMKRKKSNHSVKMTATTFP